MLFGYLPPVSNFIFGFKVDGVTTQGTVGIGPVSFADVNLNNKSNRAGTIFGDLGNAPVIYQWNSDPELVDAPMNHFGYF